MNEAIDVRVSTGCAGLDEVLAGGLTPDRLYLLEGVPGSGKTTLSLQFLLAAVAKGEPALYITLSETIDEITAVARSHAWDLSAMTLFDLAAIDEVVGESNEQTILHPWELELGEIVGLITREVERVRPTRIVFDSLSELRLLAQDPLRYRRQVLALKKFFSKRNVTVFLVDDLTFAGGASDMQLHSLCHGVITLLRKTQDYGMTRRRLEVQKIRGVRFVEGYHDLEIRRGGLEVFPRLIASDHPGTFFNEYTESGVPALDSLMGGGLLRGTCTLITGPAGSGKTTLAVQYVLASCERAEPCTVYHFDERVGTLLARASSMGSDLQEHVKNGCLFVEQLNPAEISPGEFTSMVRRQVEARGAKMIVIDSLSGYMAAMPAEQELLLHIHELVSYLNQQGVVTILVNPQHGLVGSMSTNGVDVSYVSDAVILLRFFEADGRVRKAISVLKNRSGAHEDFIREFRVDASGVRIGEPLIDFRGVLTGTPEYIGATLPLLEARADAE